MQTPLEIIFSNMEPSDAIEARIREKVEHVEKLYGRITSGHVYVDAPHQHHQKGNRYEIRIEMRVPGAELAVSNKPGDVNAHEDVYVAIRDAFDAMERQLDKYKQQKRGDVKTHEGPDTGRISEIDLEQGFGHIVVADGRYVYFHRNAVIGDSFDNLTKGDPVELVIDHDDDQESPHASTVRKLSAVGVVDKPD